jgi:hypothetical protein
VCNGLRGLKWVLTCIAWDFEVWCVVLRMKLMKMCNKKQYIYFICTFMCMFHRSLFVLFLWQLCCLFFFDIRILINPLVSSKDQTNVHNSGILCINWWLFILVSYLSRGKKYYIRYLTTNFWRVGYIFVCKKKPRIQ